MAAVLISRTLKLSLRFPIQTMHVRNNSIVAQKLIISEYGDPVKVVKLEEETLLEPKANEVFVKMLAATVNPADINTIQGTYAVKPQLPCVGGNEGVGVIEKVGTAVTNLKRGDRVLPKVNAWGTWRTHAVCDANQLFKISKDLSIVEAATFSVNPCTAYRMLTDFENLNEGDTVIQNGSNSAVGQNVIQICQAKGLNSVNIVRNRDNIDELKSFLKDLGATHVLTEEELRTTDIFKTKAIPKPKLALNCVGGKNALEMMRHLGFQGVMVTYGGMSREPVTVSTAALIFKDLRIRGYWMTQWNKENIGGPKWHTMVSEITDLYKSKKLKPPVHKMIPLSDFSEALANTMAKGGFTGCKYVINLQSG